MKAIILAGGHGNRLRPLTETVPKPLIEVAGQPIVDWQVKWLISHGIRSYIMLVGHLKGKIIEHFDSVKEELGIDVEYSVEKKPLGTGGALRNAEGMLSGEKKFFMLNGDTITNMDIGVMKLDGSIASIALVQLRSQYGVTHLDGDKIIKFEEKPMIKDYWMNSGLYLLSSEIFARLPKEGNIETETFPKLASERKITGTRFPDAYFKGVDSVKDIDEVTDDLKNGRVFGK